MTRPLSNLLHSRLQTSVWKDALNNHIPINGQAEETSLKLDILIDSLPSLLSDQPQQSSGSRTAGKVRITPSEHITLSSVSISLVGIRTVKQAAKRLSKDASTSVAKICKSNLLTQPTAFSVENGTQELSFSLLVPGHLPPTTYGHLGRIAYYFHVTAVSSDSVEYKQRTELVIDGAVRSGEDRSSVTTFPPSRMALHVSLPSVVPPSGKFEFKCRVKGITDEEEGTSNVWKPYCVEWRFEEHENVQVPQDGPASVVPLPHRETLLDGRIDMNNWDWTTDADKDFGEAKYSVSVSKKASPLVDVETADGLYKVSHCLRLDVCMIRHSTSAKHANTPFRSDLARYLRTEIAITMNHGAGSRVTWEDEQLPSYDDDSDAPPNYHGRRASGLPEKN